MRLRPLVGVSLLLVLSSCRGDAEDPGLGVPQPRDPSVLPADAQVDSRLYLSRIDSGRILAQCMRDRGFAPVVDPRSGEEVDPVSGAVTFDQADPAQSLVMGNAMGECYAVIEARMGPLPEETSEFWEKVYRGWLWTHQCLLDLGLPATDPPSLDVFVEQRFSVGVEVWHPHQFYRDWDGSIEKPPAIPEADWSAYQAAGLVYWLEDVCPENYFFLFEYLDLRKE